MAILKKKTAKEKKPVEAPKKKKELPSVPSVPSVPSSEKPSSTERVLTAEGWKRHFSKKSKS